MARTRRRYVNLQDFKNRGVDAAVVVKLMMAANDMSYANQCLGDYKAAVELGQKGLRPNGGLYWVRLQIAHMSEAFDIVRQIHNSPNLMTVVSQCDTQTQESFAKLLPYLHGGAKHREFIQLVEKVRSNVTFH